MNKRTGRPRCIANKRNKVTSIRLSQDEYNIISEKAEKLRLSISSYIRMCSIKSMVHYTITEEDRVHIRTLINMANNLNQLTKICHTENLLNMENDINSLRDALSEIIVKVKPK